MSQHIILELGLCGLHAVHGVFQTGHRASVWKVNAYLQALYGLFKDSLAGRAGRTCIHLTENNVFATKLYQMRWIENVESAE